ncbi:MAG: hypothetical protein P9F75_17810 [Candidatus Contendobacter sp.]|nr:hypothetical protein [Candidatus Contendobacter sp.]
MQFATHPDVLGRYDTMQGFLADLERVEDELTTPDSEITVDPGIAVKGDRLEGGFTVIERLGRGASSVARLVRQDATDEEFVLKVANDATHSDHVQAEGEALAKLRHPHIVEYRQTLAVAGRAALLLKLFEHQPAPLVATGADWADYARRLGAVADACALADPLLPPARVVQALEGVLSPADLKDKTPELTRAIQPSRLLRLAAAASRAAALFSRQEIYPRGMPALQALRQSLSALVGVPELGVEELKTRVRGRYAEAEPLSDRPALDRLLEAAEAPLQWDEASRRYRCLNFGGGLSSASSSFQRLTKADAAAVADTAAQEAQHLGARLLCTTGARAVCFCSAWSRAWRRGRVSTPSQP